MMNELLPALEWLRRQLQWAQAHSGTSWKTEDGGARAGVAGVPGAMPPWDNQGRLQNGSGSCTCVHRRGQSSWAEAECWAQSQKVAQRS